MSYIDPMDVTSPKVSVSNLQPIIDCGEWEYSVTLLDWDRKSSLGIRWNGGSEDDGRVHPGNPQSRGLPTWFIVPENFQGAILNTALSGELGGGRIDPDAARAAILKVLSKRSALASSQQAESSDTEFEQKVIQVIERLKAQGKL